MLTAHQVRHQFEYALDLLRASREPVGATGFCGQEDAQGAERDWQRREAISAFLEWRDMARRYQGLFDPGMDWVCHPDYDMKGRWVGTPRYENGYTA